MITKKTYFLISIGIFNITYAILGGPFHHLSIYWIVKAILELSFWLVAFFPNYNWDSYNSIKQATVVIVSLSFCLYFLPPAFILHPVMVNIRYALDGALLYTVLSDDGTSGGGGKRRRIKNKKPKLAHNY